MTSQKQINANQHNAKRSTGPISQSGKARSRKNAYRHGLTAQSRMVGEEEADEFEEFRDRLISELAPASMIEHEMLERLVVTMWRQRRVPVYEAAIIAAQYEEVEARLNSRLSTIKAMLKSYEQSSKITRPDAATNSSEKASSTKNDGAINDEGGDSREGEDEGNEIDYSPSMLGVALMRDGENGDALGKLLRYETALMNNFERTLKQLEFLRTSRLMGGDGQGDLIEAAALPPPKKAP